MSADHQPTEVADEDTIVFHGYQSLAVDEHGNEACALCWDEDGVERFGPCAKHDPSVEHVDASLTYSDLTPAQQERCDRLWREVSIGIKKSGVHVEDDGPVEAALYAACVKAAAA